MTGERIKSLRMAKKITQQELADALGITAPFVTMCESGKRTPSPESLIRIADYFNVTTDYLLGRVDNPHGIVLDGDKLPQKFKDKGLKAIALLKEAIDENGILTPEAERELSLLIAESRIRMAASPAYKKSIEPDENS